MMPVLFRIPLVNWDVPGYGVMLMLGFLLSVIWAAHRAAKSGGNPDVILNCAFIALIGGVGGSRLMFAVHYWDQFAVRGNWVNIVWAILDVRQGGLEVYGGFIGALGGTLLYLALWGHSIRWYLDIIAPSAALGMGLGRIGCLLNGCCWGQVCDLPWAVRFPFGSNPMVQQWYDGVPGTDLPKELIWVPAAGLGLDGHAASPISREVLWMTEAELAKARALKQQADELRARYGQAKTDAERRRLERQGTKLTGCQAAAANQRAQILEVMQANDLTLAELQQLARPHASRPVHPTQCYSTIVLVLLALLLSAAYWRRTRDGQVMCTLLLLEPWSRYALEVLRADNPVDTLGTFTISQFLAVLLSVLGLLGLIALRYMPPRCPRARLWEPPEDEASGGANKGRQSGART